MFTDRFIKVPIEIVSHANETLGKKEEVLCEDFMMINPMEITGWRKHYSQETNAYDNQTTVEFRNRDNMIVCLPIEQFEKLLNEQK